MEVEGRVGGIVEGFGTEAKVEGGWRGQGEEVGGLVLKEETVSVRKAIFVAVADLCCARLHLTSFRCFSTRACFASMSFIFSSRLALPA